jgi:hypothetical protein
LPLLFFCIFMILGLYWLRVFVRLLCLLLLLLLRLWLWLLLDWISLRGLWISFISFILCRFLYYCTLA